jgi:flavin reductase (DIM6/NTAB) family NADH-FMN oxidoreductase RutF
MTLPAPHTDTDGMRHIDPDAIDALSMYYLLNSVVVPRPIAWVSTIDGAGQHNLAPHSYMTIAASSPPTLLFVSIGDKDTLRNAADTGCFVVNTVNHELAERMNLTAANAPRGVSEFGFSGLTPAPSLKVAAPRVAEAPVAMECEVDRVIDVGDLPAHIVLGRVVALHIQADLFDDNDRVDPERLDAVARMGGSLYSTTRDRFTLVRPKFDDLVTAGVAAPSPDSPTPIRESPEENQA